jgi:hypothetical protein
MFSSGVAKAQRLLGFRVDEMLAVLHFRNNIGGKHSG